MDTIDWRDIVRDRDAEIVVKNNGKTCEWLGSSLPPAGRSDSRVLLSVSLIRTQSPLNKPQALTQGACQVDAGRLPGAGTAEAGCQGKGLGSCVPPEKPGLASSSSTPFLEPTCPRLQAATPCHSLARIPAEFSEPRRAKPLAWDGPRPCPQLPCGWCGGAAPPRADRFTGAQPCSVQARRAPPWLLAAFVLTSSPVDLSSKPF